jgi:hypothetical protein
MKKLFLITLLILTTLSFAKAQTLKATSINELIRTIEKADFAYKETGMLFGFISTQSCMHVSEDIVIFKNYCFPVRNYPARGFTIISKKFGMIDLYEEKISGILKRDIQITEFPDILAPYLSLPFPIATLNDLSTMIEKVHYNYNPGCWSTNHSFYTETKDAACSVATEFVEGFDDWAVETQEITSNEETWQELMRTINAKLIR